MGRIKAKRTVEPPEAVKVVIQRVLEEPLESVGEALAGFKWEYEKGDVHQWIPLLDHFDAYFEKHLKDRGDLQLKVESGDAQDPPFPSATVVAVLRATASILEHSNNKHLYNSFEYLTLLLAAPDTAVVLATLQALLAYVRKGSHGSSLRWAAPEDLAGRLRAMAQSWGLRDEGLGLLGCGAGQEGPGVQVPAALHFEFYEEQQPAAGAAGPAGEGGSAATPAPPTAASTPAAGPSSSQEEGGDPTDGTGLRVIEIPVREAGHMEEGALLRQLVQAHRVPAKHRFALLQKVRLARGLSSPAGRQDLVRVRLLAFAVAFQSSPSTTDLLSFFTADPEFVPQLASLVRAEPGAPPVPLDVQALALRALAIQLMDRTRHTSVVAAVASGGQAGLLAALLHRAATTLHAEPAAQQAAQQQQHAPIQSSSGTVGSQVAVGEAGKGPGVAYVEALLSLVGALVASTAGTQALSEAGLIPALLPLLRDTHADHLPLVASTVRILEAFMDFNPSSGQLFRELGGLTLMVQRLKAEVGLGSSSGDAAASGAEAMATEQAQQQQGAGAGVGDQPSTSAQQAERQAPRPASPAPGDPGFGKPTVPYMRRLLLKSLLRGIAMASYTSGGGARPAEGDAAELYACLRAIFERASDFGGGLFALAASVVTDLIHHDPLIYRSLEEAGLPQAFLESVTRRVVPSMEAVAAVPNTLVALCLNQAGLERVRDSKALYCLVPVFTSRHYLRALQGEAASMLGSSLDELLRHVPRLRQEGVDVALQVLRRLCILGGDPSPPTPSPMPAPGEAEGEGSSEDEDHSDEEGESDEDEEGGGRGPGGDGGEGGEQHGAAGEGEAMDTDARSVEEMEIERPAPAASQQQQPAAPQQQPGEHQRPPPPPGEQQPAGGASEGPPAAAPAAPTGDADMAPALAQEGAAGTAQQVVQQGDDDLAAVPAGEAESYLVECVTYTARMLEQMLASTETARIFIERGGVDLLLALYRLPRLPPSFGSTNASHALLVAFRVFTTGQGSGSAQVTKTFGLLRGALIQQLDAALDAAREVGGASVPLLPAERREAYVRAVCSAEGLTALAAAVVRNSSATLKEISNGDISVILKLGDLERRVLWQAAVAEEWRLANDAANAAKDAKEAAPEPQAQQQQAQQGDQVMQEAGPAAAPAAAGAPAPAGEAEGDRSAGELSGSSGGSAGGDTAKRRKGPQELCADILLHFAATARAFYQSVAKAIHVPAGRRREELTGAPAMSMKAAAVNLAVVIRKNLEFEPPEDTSVKGKEPAVPDAAVNPGAAFSSLAARRVRYTQRVLDTAFHVLYDARRRSCHTLVYNYFVACGGLKAFVRHFPEVLDLLRALPPPPAEAPAPQQAQQQQQQGSDAEMAESPGAAAAPPAGQQAQQGAGVAGSSAGAAGAGGSSSGSSKPVDPAAAYRRSLEHLASTSLVFMTNLSYVNMVTNSPNAVAFITAPVPGTGSEGKEVRAAEDIPAFMRRVWGVLLGAVLPLWRDIDLLAQHPKLVQPLVSVMRNCMENPAQLQQAAATAARAGAAGARAHRVANPALVQGIVEMGFSQARAEEALRQVGNSVELAMEWLIAHPAPEEEEGAGAGAAGAGASAGQQAQQGDDEALAQMVADTLSVEGERMALLQEAEHDPGSAALPDSIALVDGSVALAERCPSCSFWLCDMLKSHAALSTPNRQSVLARLMWHLSSRAAPSDAQLLAPAQLLSILVNEAGGCREAAAEKGLSSVALDAVEAWVLARLPHKPAAAAATPGPSKHGGASPASQAAAGTAIPVPKWVDALLLALDVMANTQPKPTPAATEAAAAASGPAPAAQQPAAEGGEQPAAASAAAAAAGQQAEQAPGGAAPAGAAAAGEAAAPADSTASILRDGSLEPQPSTAAGPSAVPFPNPPAAAAGGGGGSGEGTAAPAGEAGGAAGTAPAAATPALEQDPLQKVLGAVAAQWHVGGLLSDQEQQRAVDVCLTLLRHVHAHGTSWLPSPAPDAKGGDAAAAAASNVARQAPEVAHQPDPASTLHAVLQLLARLTKRHEVAAKFLSIRGPALLLDLPAPLYRPELEPYCAALMRHCLEDPATLQAAMEAEIRSTLAEKARSTAAYRYTGREPDASMQLRTFLSVLAQVAAREPSVFVEAVRATCTLSEAGPGMVGGRRAMIALKKKPEAPAPQQQQPGAEAAAKTPGPASRPVAAAGGRGEQQATPAAAPALGATAAGTAAKAAGGPEGGVSPEGAPAGGKLPATTPGQPKTSGKPTKKVPASFLEVVDSLVDVLLRYHGPPPPAAATSAGTEEGTAAAAGAAGTAGAEGTAGAGAAAGGAVQVLPRTDGSLEIRLDHARAAAAGGKKGGLSAEGKEVAVQCFALRLLADFTLMYQHCVGVLLKRDTDLATKEVVTLRGGTATKRAERPAVGLLRHVSDVHLALGAEQAPKGSTQSMGAAASTLLLAVCIRSAEGRRRIVSHVVSTLSGGASSGETSGRKDAHTPFPLAATAAATPAALASTPFVAKSGRPPPYKIKAFVDLAAFLLSTSASSPGRAVGAGAAGRGGQPGGGLSTEIVRAMKEGGMVAALTQALQLVDLDHPDAVRSIHAILRPLEVLTRPWPRRPGAVGAAGDAAAGAAAEPAGAGAAGAAAATGGPAAGVEGAEAGPQALAAAEHALEAVDRHRARRERRELEDMMEAMMEQYGEEEGSEGSGSDEEMGEESFSEGEGGSEDEEEEGGSGMEGSEGPSGDDDGNDLESMSSESEDEDGSSLGDEEVEVHLVEGELGEDDSEMEEGEGSEDQSESDIEEEEEGEGGEGEEFDAADAEALVAAVAAGEPGGLGAAGVEGEEEEDFIAGLEREAREERRLRQELGEDGEEDEMGLELEDEYDDDEEDYYAEEDEEGFGAEEDEEAAAALREPTDLAGFELPGAGRRRGDNLDTILDELNFMNGGRVRVGRNQFLMPNVGRGASARRPTASGPAAAASVPAQHPLLTRPTSGHGAAASAAAGTSAAARVDAATRMHGLTPGDFELMQQALAPLGLTPDVLFNSMLGGLGGPAYMPPPQARMPSEAAAPGAGGRSTNWSDGDAAGAASFSTLAQTLERALADNLIERPAAPPPAPQHPAAALLAGIQEPDAAAAPAAPAVAATEPAGAPAVPAAAQQDTPMAAAEGEAGAAAGLPAATTASGEAAAAAAGEPAAPSAAGTAAATGARQPQPAAQPAVTDAASLAVMLEAAAAAAGLAPAPGPAVPAAPAPAPAPAAPASGITADVFQQALQAAIQATSSPANPQPEAYPPQQQQQQQDVEPPSPPPPAVDAGGDVEMGEAAPAEEATQQAQQQQQQQPEEGGPPPLDDALRMAAEAAGIDLPFLDALPPELRTEVLESAGIRLPASAPAPLPAQPPAAAPPAAVEAAAAAAAVPAEPAAPAVEAPAPGGGGAAERQQSDEMEGIDPEFLAALPPDLQAEVVEQQRMQRRMREAQRRREEQRRAAAGAAGAGGAAAGPAELDFASLLATFPPEVREDVLMTADEGMLRTLPPALLAEAQALRERLSRLSDARQAMAAAAAAAAGAGGAAAGLHLTYAADGRHQPRVERVEFLPVAGGGGTRARLDALRRQADRLGGPAGAATDLATARRGAGAASEPAVEPPPEVGEEALVTLVRLLKLSQPIGKSQLQRLFHNLCANSQTRESLLRILVSTLRAPLSADEAQEGAAAQQPPSGSGLQPDAVIQGSALGRRWGWESSGGGAAAAGSSAAAAAVQLGLARPHEGGCVPPLVSRRVLEVLCYLCRHQAKVAGQLVGLAVPPLEALARRLAARHDVKGKGRVGEEADGGTESALCVLLAMPSRPICRRSDSHLLQALELLTALLRPFEDEEYARGVLRKAEQEEEQEAEAAKAAAEAQRAQQAAQPQESGSASAMQTDSSGQQAGLPQQQQQQESPEGQQQHHHPPGGGEGVPSVGAGPAGAGPASPAEHIGSEAVGAAPGAPPPPPPAGVTPAGDPPALAADAPAGAAAGSAAGPAASAGEAGVPSGAGAGAGPSGSGSAGAAGPSKAAAEAGDGPVPSAAAVAKVEEEEREYRRVKAALAALPKPLLRSLPQLLAEESVSDRAATLVKVVIQGLNLLTPAQLPLALGELGRVLGVLADRATQGLRALAGSDLGGGGALLASDVARVGRLMLRCVTCIWENAGQLVREAPKRAAPQEEVDACRHSVLSTLGALQQALEPLWRQLSAVAGQVEEVLRASKTSEAAKVLPPGAAQLQPLVECLFILADVRTQVEEKPPAAAAAGLSQGVAGGAATPMEAYPSQTLSPRASGSLSGGSPHTAGSSADGQVSALRFAEQHRRLVNVLVHHHPALLTTSLQALMRLPRLLDFDNKRTFFRQKVKESDGAQHYGTVRIHVRRDHVFEDSFYQLRMRTPAEMKAKLNVVFQGEEGVDAGGVTREWYQVMSREMFNPQFSLFQAVPEGGTTFQPNPNSIIQNDEARGTNHLDFFKFVGRVVGKALHDGQYVDAHFTRSFYKHLLGQPLTYGDIEAVDPDFHKNLAWMLENDITDVLDLTFAEEADYFGRKQVVELRPGGAHIKVTNENKREYVDLVARHRMTTAIREQLESFQRGFWDVVPKDLISMFTDHELELLISGLPEIDVADLRANTEYAGYASTSPVVTWFWEVVRDMDKQDLALLVQFVTGTSKVPLDGFKALQGVHGPQKFQIHKAYGDTVRLPSAHTCFNQLDLIEYESKEQLRERLMTAIHEGSEGFGFA